MINRDIELLLCLEAYDLGKSIDRSARQSIKGNSHSHPVTHPDLAIGTRLLRRPDRLGLHYLQPQGRLGFNEVSLYSPSGRKRRLPDYLERAVSPILDFRLQLSASEAQINIDYFIDRPGDWIKKVSARGTLSRISGFDVINNTDYTWIEFFLLQIHTAIESRRKK